MSYGKTVERPTFIAVVELRVPPHRNQSRANTRADSIILPIRMTVPTKLSRHWAQDAQAGVKMLSSVNWVQKIRLIENFWGILCGKWSSPVTQ